MKIFKTKKSVLIAINAKLAYATFLGAVSYAIFPTSMKWYGFGLLSVLAGLAGAALAFNALRQIADASEFEDGQEEFLDRGTEVKTSQLLSKDFLTKKGVIRK